MCRLEAGMWRTAGGPIVTVVVEVARLAVSVTAALRPKERLRELNTLRRLLAVGEEVCI
jgi:hypothetical protein